MYDSLVKVRDQKILNEVKALHEELKAKVMAVVSQHFKPEFPFGEFRFQTCKSQEGQKYK